MTILEALMCSAPADDGRPLAEALLDNLPLVLQNWRALPHFLRLILAFARPHIAEARAWFPRIFEHIQTAFDAAKAVFLQSVNLSCLFAFFGDNIDVLTSAELAQLCALAPHVFHNPVHGDSYMAVVRRCADRGIVQMSEFVEQLLASIKNTSELGLITIFMQLVHDDTTAAQFMRSPRVSKETFFRAIASRLAGDVRKRLIAVPKILFLMMTCNVASVYDAMEHLFLQLFPNVTSLGDYPCVETCDNRDSFDWKDAPDAGKPKPDERLEMRQLADGLIDGCANICERPLAFLVGTAGSTRLAPLLRVLFWLLLRADVELAESQVNTLIALFDALRAPGLPNDANTLELMRILHWMPTTAWGRIAERFGHIAELIFTATFINEPTLEAWYFGAFFDLFGDFMRA
jgi:hypothetical protein